MERDAESISKSKIYWCLMILFSLGTHSQDFSRMAKAADDYAAITDEGDDCTDWLY